MALCRLISKESCVPGVSSVSMARMRNYVGSNYGSIWVVTREVKIKTLREGFQPNPNIKM